MCWVERDATPPAQAATLPSDPPRQAAMRDAAAIRRWIKASSTASAQMKRGTSGGFELALGAQPVSDLVEAALFEVDEARALGDLVMTGLAGLRLRRSRVRSLTGALCGIGGHDDPPLSKSIRWVQAASQRRAFCTAGSAAFGRANVRARTSTLAGWATIVISSPVAGARPVRALRAGLTPTVNWNRPADPAIRADDRFGRGTAFGRAIASATLERSGRAGAGDRNATFAIVARASAVTGNVCPVGGRDRCYG